MAPHQFNNDKQGRLVAIYLAITAIIAVAVVGGFTLYRPTLVDLSCSRTVAHKIGTAECVFLAQNTTVSTQRSYSKGYPIAKLGTTILSSSLSRFLPLQKANDIIKKKTSTVALTYTGVGYATEHCTDAHLRRFDLAELANFCAVLRTVVLSTSNTQNIPLFNQS